MVLRDFQLLHQDRYSSSMRGTMSDMCVYIDVPDTSGARFFEVHSCWLSAQDKTDRKNDHVKSHDMLANSEAGVEWLQGLVST